MSVTVTGFQIAVGVCALVAIGGVILIATDKGENDPFGWGTHPSANSYGGCALIILAAIVAGALWLGSAL